MTSRARPAGLANSCDHRANRGSALDFALASARHVGHDALVPASGEPQALSCRRTTVRFASFTFVAVAAVVSGCSSDEAQPSGGTSSPVNTDVSGSVTAASTSVVQTSAESAGLPAPTARDFPEVLGAAARAATSSRSNAPNLAGHIQVADVLIEPTAMWSLPLNAPNVPLSDTERAGIEAAYSPFFIFFEKLSADGPMLLLSQPVIEGTSVIVAYEIRCGLDPGAMCAVGGAFRLEKADGEWTTTETISEWVS